MPNVTKNDKWLIYGLCAVGVAAVIAFAFLQGTPGADVAAWIMVLAALGATGALVSARLRSWK